MRTSLSAAITFIFRHSFGSFHLLRLFTDEFMLFLIENVALHPTLVGWEMGWSVD